MPSDTMQYNSKTQDASTCSYETFDIMTLQEINKRRAACGTNHQNKSVSTHTQNEHWKQVQERLKCHNRMITIHNTVHEIQNTDN